MRDDQHEMPVEGPVLVVVGHICTVQSIQQLVRVSSDWADTHLHRGQARFDAEHLERASQRQAGAHAHGRIKDAELGSM
jgi:hypothetical protein